MLNNHQRHYASRLGLYPHYASALPGRYDFGQLDLGLSAYRPDGSQSLYARDEFTHLAPQLLPAQQHSALAPSFAASPFPVLEQHTLSHRPRHIQQPVYCPVVANAACTSVLMDDEQLARMQQLSANFEPEVKGPLVSDLQQSHVLVQEYANADQVYRRKTASIAAAYSNIRTIRGDGQCGWRAITLGYFERLLSCGDASQLLLQEEARLRSLTNIVRLSGIDPDIYEDFAFPTFTLLRDLGTAVRNGTAQALLTERFCDEETQNFVITQMKTLTAAWLKTHIEDYNSFLVESEIDSYCEQNVMPVKAEIDQISMMALKDVLLAPAGIGLEVEYLDLSPGQEGTLHRFTRPGQSVHLGCVRLLYRPGHYDLLYRTEDLPPPPVTAFFQISSRTQDEHFAPVGKPDFMHLIPGMSTVAAPQAGWQSTPHFDMSDLFDLPAAAQPMHSMSLPPIVPKAPVRSQHLVAPQPKQTLAQQDIIPNAYLLDPVTLHNISSQTLEPGTPFRLTDWHHKQDTETSQMPAQLQTAQFKNSHYNTAHFNNPDFQPEAWSPDHEEKKALEDALGQVARSNRYRRLK